MRGYSYLLFLFFFLSSTKIGDHFINFPGKINHILPGELYKQVDTVKIGLLVTDKQSTEIINAAYLAISKANRNRQPGERFYKLAVRDMEGPWGTGSKMMVDLVFNEKVWAVLGSVDGRNSHLIEQVAAKSHVVFLNARCGDPTLSKAFVPWYFSIVPNDIQQTEEYFKKISSEKDVSIAIVSDDGYDSKLASESFARKASISFNQILNLHYLQSKPNFNDIIRKIKDLNPGHIALFGQYSSSLELIKMIRGQKLSPEIFCPLSLIYKASYPYEKELDNVITVSLGYLFNREGMNFSAEFKKTYAKPPGSGAAFAFDGLNVLIDAVKRTDVQDNMQKSVSKTYYKGITGIIRFDDKGNNIGTTGLMEINNGQASGVEKN